MSWKVPISGAGQTSNQRRRGLVLVAVTYAAVLVGVTLPSPLWAGSGQGGHGNADLCHFFTGTRIVGQTSPTQPSEAPQRRSA